MKPIFIAWSLSLVGIFIAGFAFGYYERGRIYKKTTELQQALDALPDSLAISVIEGSNIGRKNPHVPIGHLTTFYHTNKIAQ